MKKALFLMMSFTLILFSSSCGDEQEPVDQSTFGYDYFILEVGKYIEYQSDSINYFNLGFIKDTVSGFVREEIVDQFTDQLGEDIYTIHRSFRRNAQDNWELTDVWTASMDETRAFRTEENLKFVKLVFPVIENKRWDGNAFFDDTQEIEVNSEFIEMYAGWNHKIEEVDVAYDINDQSYSETAYVRLVDSEDGFKKLNVFERYAKGVGLIEKTMTILETQNNNSAIPFEDRAEKGFIHHLKVIDHN